MNHVISILRTIMSCKNVFSRVVLHHAACRAARGCRTRPGRLYSSSECGGSCPIHPELLKVLVCPLSKEPLRYDASTNELVCDKLGVAYPVINGVPNLVPQDGRLIGTRSREENT